VEHQNEKEKPGEKGQEQKQQEENRSVTLSARQTDFAANPSFEKAAVWGQRVRLPAPVVTFSLPSRSSRRDCPRWCRLRRNPY
jgi:hypothetical protein